MKTLTIIRITTVPVSLRILLSGQLKFINDYYRIIAVSSQGADLQAVNVEQGVEIKAVNMTRGISPIKDIIAIVKLYFIFKKEKPFIVHSHTPKAGFVGLIAAKFAGVPIKLHTVAGLPLIEYMGFKRIVLNLIEKLTYLFADRIYPNSFVLHDFIIRNKFSNSKKIKVLGRGSTNGIDTDFFLRTPLLINQGKEIRKECHINEDNIVFCFVGRIVKDKGINELLECFDEISQYKDHVNLLLIGTFEEDLDPISVSSKNILKLNQNVIQCGWQDDVRPYLAASDVLVFPSYREGFPNVPMQAGAMGLPSIVTNINGCNEIIEHGKNGLIVEPKNKEQLKAAMIKLIEDQQLRNYLAGNARQMIKEKYEQKFVWNELLKEYQSLESQSHNINSIYSKFLKRLLDIMAAFILLILTLPISIIASLLLFFACGKVFFIQPRPGKDSKLFNLIKFKTMNDKTDKQGSLLPDHERLTFIGKLIRKASLDELPQLINVVKGDMSLIGPRPLLVEYLPLYNEDQKRRHNVKPGITGWAQVNGRNSLSWKEKFDLDLYYVDNISFKLDIKIFFLTILKIIKSEGISQEGHVTMTKFSGNN